MMPRILPDTLSDQQMLEADERFRFACHSGLSCFNRCCADVNILLTPVDAIRLARRLGLSTSEFLDRHTLTPITKDLHLPVMVLRMGDEPERKCPMVGDNGCTVYEARPWACRMYPVGMALPPARAGVEPQPIYYLIKDDFCEGKQEQTEWTMTGWRADQGVDEIEKLELGFQEIVSHPWFIGGRQLDARRMEMFHMVCYDLDKFRSFVFESTFLQRFEVPEDKIEKLRHDDFELLRFGFLWLRLCLFGEPTLKVRQEPSPARTT